MGAECSKLRQPMRAILALSRAQLLLIVVTRSRDLSRECHVTKHKMPAKSNFPMSNFENSGTIQFSSSRSTSKGLCPKNFEKKAHPTVVPYLLLSRALDLVRAWYSAREQRHIAYNKTRCCRVNFVFVYNIFYRRASAWPSGCICRVCARAKVYCIQTLYTRYPVNARLVIYVQRCISLFAREARVRRSGIQRIPIARHARLHRFQI